MPTPKFRQLLLALCCLSASLACGNGDKSPSAGAGAAGAPATEPFSFFVTSLRAMQELSGSPDGFGGDLRFGETGAGAGLRGADKICTTIAEKSLAGNAKTWRAFLSATQGEDGAQVDAIERIGEGPWYDRVGRLVAANKADLAQVRPEGADAAIVDDLPNEDGVPNHAPDPMAGEVDNHDVLTGTNDEGKLFSPDAGSTCNDWTSAVGSAGRPRCGHSWPRRGGPGDGPDVGPGMMMPGEGGAFSGDPISRGGGPMGIGGGGMFMTGDGNPTVQGSGDNWMSALDEAGCAPGAFIVEAGPPGANGTETVGDGGGYGAIYCFALTP
jgi:hypothetical protein